MFEKATGTEVIYSGGEDNYNSSDDEEQEEHILTTIESEITADNVSFTFGAIHTFQ